MQTITSLKVIFNILPVFIYCISGEFEDTELIFLSPDGIRYG
jgi:hypothetical protein